MLHQTSRGLLRNSARGSIPARSRVPGRKFSTTTSAFSISARTTSRSFSAVKIRCDAQLVPVDAEVVRALSALVEGRTPLTRIVAARRPLHLDDVGPEIAEEHGTQRARKNSRDIQHSDAVQW